LIRLIRILIGVNNLNQIAVGFFSAII
jgi:hypothetical protein